MDINYRFVGGGLGADGVHSAGAVTRTKKVSLSDCNRTGCCGCAISSRATADLEKIRPYEPNLVKAAWNVFGDSYRYRQMYNEYKAQKMGGDMVGQLTFKEANNGIDS